MLEQIAGFHAQKGMVANLYSALQAMPYNAMLL
jgi:hypothetical protein